jgi:hypothetical protein
MKIKNFPKICVKNFDDIYKHMVPGSLVCVTRSWHYDSFGELFHKGDVCLVIASNLHWLTLQLLFSTISLEEQ